MQHGFCKIRATEHRLKYICNSNQLLYLGRINEKSYGQASDRNSISRTSQSPERYAQPGFLLPGYLLSFIINTFNSIVSIVENSWNAVMGFIRGAIILIISVVSNGISGIANWFSQLPGRILGAIGNLASLLLGGGGSIVDCL